MQAFLCDKIVVLGDTIKETLVLQHKVVK